MNASLRAYMAALMWLVFCSITLSWAGAPVKSPAEIVRITYEAANAGRYADAETHLSAVALAQINGLMARLAGGHLKLWNGWTKNRSITRIEVLKEVVHNGQATVFYRFHFKDGSSKEDDDSLVLEDGEWKLLP